MKAPGDDTQGVLTLGTVKPSSWIPAAMLDPGAKGWVGKIGSRDPDPPARAAGLVQRTCWPGAVVRPNRELAGGTASKVEKAMTQPTWLDRWQAGMCLKSPPTSEPRRTVTFPPSSTAETSSLRTEGWGSISDAMSWRRMNAPWEWPMTTTPRPWLNWWRYVAQAWLTSS